MIILLLSIVITYCYILLSILIPITIIHCHRLLLPHYCLLLWLLSIVIDTTLTGRWRHPRVHGSYLRADPDNNILVDHKCSSCMPTHEINAALGHDSAL